MTMLPQISADVDLEPNEYQMDMLYPHGQDLFDNLIGAFQPNEGQQLDLEEVLKAYYPI